MRKTLPQKAEAGRIKEGYYASDSTYGPIGAFVIQGPTGATLRIISCDAGPETEGWEHVSVSVKHRIPSWQEMCFIKDLFWEEEECVIQFHPPKSEYVNCHPNCLHLWGYIHGKIPTPPAHLVGPKSGQDPSRQE
jgi:hypothetical protein